MSTNPDARSRGGGLGTRPCARAARDRPARAAHRVLRPGAGAQRQLRADQRLHRSPRRRPDPEEPGRDPRAERLGAPRREPHAGAAGGDPAAHLRAHPARRAPPQDHAAGGVRARPLDLPVLRARARQPDGRPRGPALEGRRVDLGQHRHLLRAVQPPQGRPAAAAGEHGAAQAPKAPSRRSSSTSPRPTIPAAWEQYLVAA